MDLPRHEVSLINEDPINGLGIARGLYVFTRSEAILSILDLISDSAY